MWLKFYKVLELRMILDRVSKLDPHSKHNKEVHEKHEEVEKGCHLCYCQKIKDQIAYWEQAIALTPRSQIGSLIDEVAEPIIEDKIDFSDKEDE